MVGLGREASARKPSAREGRARLGGQDPRGGSPCLLPQLRARAPHSCSTEAPPRGASDRRRGILHKRGSRTLPSGSSLRPRSSQQLGGDCLQGYYRKTEPRLFRELTPLVWCLAEYRRATPLDTKASHSSSQSTKDFELMFCALLINDGTREVRF